MISDAQVKALLQAATEARANAYCPYSHFAVGAAVLLADGRIFSGCNVENVSYGLTICAERNAIAAAVGAGLSPGDLIGVAVVAHGPQRTVPCGACLQVLGEFAAPECQIYARGMGQHDIGWELSELLPQRFGAG